jgi:hypothetical protein
MTESNLIDRKWISHLHYQQKFRNSNWLHFNLQLLIEVFIFWEKLDLPYKYTLYCYQGIIKVLANTKMHVGFGLIYLGLNSPPQLVHFNIQVTLQFCTKNTAQKIKSSTHFGHIIFDVKPCSLYGDKLASLIFFL